MRKPKILKISIIVIVTILALFSLLLIIAPNRIKAPNINKNNIFRTTNIKETTLERFEGQVFISGRLLNSDGDENDVMTLNNEIYISSGLLNKYFKTKLIADGRNYIFAVRFIEKKLDEIVKYNDKYYLALSMLDTYFTYSKHHLENDNALFIYDTAPNNIRLNDELYEKQNEDAVLSDLNATFAEASPEGFGIYKTDNKNIIWVVKGKDDTRAIKYNIDMTGPNIMK